MGGLAARVVVGAFGVLLVVVVLGAMFGASPWVGLAGVVYVVVRVAWVVLAHVLHHLERVARVD